MTRPDPDMTPPVRLSVEDAAKLLGLSVDAVRKRIERGTLRSEKVDKTRYVLLDNLSTDHDSDMTRHDSDTIAALVAELKDRMRFLESELEDRKEEARRKDHLLAAALERIPELEAPPEARESPEPRSEGPTPTESESAGGAQEDTERRSWWRRMFDR
jgi:excisionase family DNA binding protein